MVTAWVVVVESAVVVDSDVVVASLVVEASVEEVDSANVLVEGELPAADSVSGIDEQLAPMITSTTKRAERRRT